MLYNLNDATCVDQCTHYPWSQHTNGLICSMLSHTTVPSTTRLEELVAAVVLGDPTPFDIREKGTTLFQYKDATGLDAVQTEIVRMVCIRMLFLTIC
jgi:hypothetical protein